MILEAFSQILHQHRDTPAETLLEEWLWGILSTAPQDNVSRVIHAEIAVLLFGDKRYFEGRSPSGRILLDSLREYCHSYEQWQFSRWLHHMRASDFPFSNERP